MIKERHPVDPDEILKSWTLGSSISFFSFFEFITFLTPWLFRPLQFLRLLFFSGCQNVKSGFFYHIDDRQNGQQLLNAIWNIWIRIIKSIWMTNYAKIANHGQNLKFHFLVKKWLSLGELLNPIPYGLFEGFFVLTHAYEDDTWKHATCSLHKHFRSG